jgi:hypothetical protein
MCTDSTSRPWRTGEILGILTSISTARRPRTLTAVIETIPSLKPWLKHREFANDIQGVEAESFCEVSPEAGEHQVRGENIALDLCIIPSVVFNISYRHMSYRPGAGRCPQGASF